MAFKVGDLIASLKIDLSQTVKAMRTVKSTLQQTFGKDVQNAIRNLAKSQEQIRYENALAAQQAAIHADKIRKQAEQLAKAETHAIKAATATKKAVAEYERLEKLVKQQPKNTDLANQLEAARKQVEIRYSVEKKSITALQKMKTSTVEMSAALKKATNQAKNMYDHLKSVERIVGGILISQAFYQGVGEIERAIQSVFRFTGEMEKAQIAFETFLGTPEKASAFMWSLKEFAAETSFNTAQAFDLSKQLMGVGVAAEQARSYMEVLNDTAAATGASAEVIDRIVYAIAQVKATGKLMGQEMRQLQNANIPIYDILSEQLGIAKSELRNIGELNIDGDVGVAALLQGLEKRYKGTAERLSNTVPGLIDNIKDNLLMLSAEALKGPWEAFGNYLRNIREELDSWRDIIADVGIGGLMEQLIGPGATQTMRVVIGSVGSLIKSLMKLASAMKPVVATIMGGLMQALSVILPPIATLMRVLSNLAHFMLNTIAPVRYLVAAIATLTVAFAAGKALMFLWKVTGLGIICKTVAKAVLILRNSIILLNRAIAKNPIIAAIMILIAALLGLALSSETVSKYLDKLMNKFYQLAGFDTEGILEVKDLGMGDLAEEYKQTYDSINDVTEALDEQADQAEETGKAFKKFLASFDEVFQVPEPEELDEGMKPPYLPFDPNDLLPDEQDIEGPEVELNISDDFDFTVWPWIENLKKWVKDNIPKIDPIEVLVPIVLIAVELEAQLKKLRERIREGIEALGGVLQGAWDWVLDPGFAFDFANQFILALSPALQFAKLFVETLGYVFEGFGKSFTDALIPVGQFAGRLVEVLVPPLTFGRMFGEVLGKVFWSLGDVFGEVLKPVENFARGFTEALVPVLAFAAVFMNNLSTVFSAGFSALRTRLGEFITHAKIIATAGLMAIGREGRKFLEWYINLWVEGWEKLKQGASGLWEFLKGTFDGIIQDTLLFINIVITAILGVLTWLAGGARGLAAGARVAFQDGFDGIVTAVGNFGTNISTTWEDIKVNATRIVSGMWTTVKGEFSTSIDNVLRSAGTFVTNIGTTFGGISTEFLNAVKGLPSTFSTQLNSVVSEIPTFVSSIAREFGKLPGKIASAIKDLPKTVMESFGRIKIPTFSDMGGAITATWKKLSLPGYATGGIIKREHMAMVGEGGKKEAIIPLENSSAMAPFADAVADRLSSQIGGQSHPTDERPILYVGTLIADDRSLRELERKMNVIRLNENARGVR